mgnify:CR=1 FL=1
MSNSITARQKEYMEKRAVRMMRSLSHLVREHNPALSVSMQIDPLDREVKIEVVEKKTTKHGVRHVYTLDADFNLYWNHGKRFVLYVPNINDPQAHEVHMHRRGTFSGRQIFALLKDHLPARDLSRTFKLVSFVDEGRVKLRDPEAKKDSNNARQKMRSKKNAPGPRETVTDFEPMHIKFINKRIGDLEKIFRDRTPHLFDNVEMEPTFNADKEGKVKPRLNLRLRPKPKHHARGTTPEIWIAGDLSMKWRGSKVKDTRINFTPTHGLPGNNATFASINLTRRSADTVREIYNLLVTSRLLINTSKKNKTPQPETVAPLPEATPRQQRTQYHRPRNFSRRNNNSNFAARIKGGNVPGF